MYRPSCRRTKARPSGWKSGRVQAGPAESGRSEAARVVGQLLEAARLGD